MSAECGGKLTYRGENHQLWFSGMAWHGQFGCLYKFELSIAARETFVARQTTRQHLAESSFQETILLYIYYFLVTKRWWVPPRTAKYIATSKDRRWLILKFVCNISASHNLKRTVWFVLSLAVAAPPACALITAVTPNECTTPRWQQKRCNFN